MKQKTQWQQNILFVIPCFTSFFYQIEKQFSSKEYILYSVHVLVILRLKVCDANCDSGLYNFSILSCIFCYTNQSREAKQMGVDG